MTWQIRKLGEVCDFQNGFAFKSKMFKEKGSPVLRISNIQKDEISFNRLVFFDKESYNENLNKYRVLRGDLVIAMSGATTGKLAISNTDEIFYLNQRVGKFKPKKDLSKNYLYYFLSNRVEENLQISAGSAQPNLSTEQIKNFEIPTPPLSEQKRIVSILDKLFEEVGKAKGNAEKNLRNSRELFGSYLQRVFENGGEEWEKNTLKNITTKIGSGATPRGGKNSYKTEGMSLIRSLNVYDQGFKLRKLAFIDENQADKLSNVAVETGDVLLNITGASVTRCCIVPDDILPARVNQHVSIIRLQKEIMYSDFLHYLLISQEYKNRLLKTGAKGGSTRQAITKTEIEGFTVEYPKTLAKQKAIVRKLDALSEETKKLEEIYKKEIADLEELKKSVLQKAFRGEL